MKNAIVVALVVIVGGLAFYGGTRYEKSALASASSQFQGGMRNGMRRGQFGQGGVASGQIISQNSNGITVQLSDGSSKIVFLSSTTKVAKFVDGTQADLTTGQYVFVTGTPNSDGSVTAQEVQLRPAPARSPSPSPSAQ